MRPLFNEATQEPASSGKPATFRQAARGDRLHPPRSSRIYWHLVCLRDAFEAVAREYLAQREGLLVDLGCGDAPYRPLFAPYVSTYLGCDLPGSSRADVYFTSDGTVPIESATADVVLSSQVLEHVADPAAYLCEARRLLKPGGLLVVSTHGIWKYHPDPEDFWRWTRDGLVKLIGGQGFAVLRVHGVLGPAATAIQHWQDAVIPRMRRKRLRDAFVFAVQWWVRRADLRCSPAERERDAGTYVVVAEKE